MPASRVYFGGPDREPGFLRDLLAQRVAALPGLRAAELGFYVVVLWQAACLAWHAERGVRFWNARPAR